MSLDPSILETIEKLYASSTDESLWPEAMQSLLTITDSVGATFCVIERSDEPRIAAFSALNFEQSFVDDYLQNMIMHDPTVQYIVAHPDKHLVHDSEVITEREKDKHFYYDWHHRYSDTRHRLAGMALIENRVSSGVTVHRTRSQGDYHPDAIRRFNFLLPHLERAVSIAVKLGTLGTALQVSFDLLNANQLGIIILDETARVAFANDAAQELSNAEDGLTITSEGVFLQHGIENGKLQRLVGEALNLQDLDSRKAVGIMKALRRSGKRPFSIFVSPLRRTQFLLAKLRPAVCIVISDPEREASLSDVMLRSLYGLTQTEFRLARHLANGAHLRAAATDLQITYKTARTHLAAIFRKTSTSRQAELVALLLSHAIPPLYAANG
jgi:DNA-binding CsgD family transcriptional regulator